MTVPVFYFDFNSPYAWLAAERIDDVLPVAPRWQPISFGPILQSSGRVPWSVADPSRAKGIAEVERRAAERGLGPVQWLDGWPVEVYSLAPLRAMAYVQGMECERELAIALFRAFFHDGRQLVPDTVAEVAQGLGLNPDDVRDGVDDPDCKNWVKRATDAAIERGVVGVPTVAVGDQLFWGDDRLEDAAAALS